MSGEKEKRNDEKNVMKADLWKFIVVQIYYISFRQINRYKDEEKK